MEILGPSLSKTFQSFSHGPELEGSDCELHQIEKLLEIDLTPFTLRNYSGLWDESDFPPDQSERLIQKQLEEDKKWNDLSEFLSLIEILISALKMKKLTSKNMNHRFNWWGEYFDFELRNKNADSFYNDLKTIEKFLIESQIKGETKAAFYVE
jgi:hypothetical protein